MRSRFFALQCAATRMPSPRAVEYVKLSMFRTIFFFPSAIRLFNFSRRTLLSSPSTMRPSSATTDTPSTSRSVIFNAPFVSLLMHRRKNCRMLLGLIPGWLSRLG
jgi:hypothetical protein